MMPLFAIVLSALLLTPSARAAEPTFADLLAKARAEVAAGQHFSPPGDNVTETFMAMINILPQATTEQLSEFDDLLQQQRRIMNGATARVPIETPSPAPDKTITATVPPPADARPDPSQSHATEIMTATREAPAETPKPTTTSVLTTLPTDKPVPEPPPEAALPLNVTPPPAAPAPGAAIASAPAPAPASAMTPVSPAPVWSAAPAASPAAPTSAAPSPPILAAPIPAAMTAQLFARGQAAEEHGDISGARRLYKVAAEQKHQGAALALAQLYDPDYLRRTTIGGIAPDPAAARYWYQQAEALAAIPPGPRPATVSER